MIQQIQQLLRILPQCLPLLVIHARHRLPQHRQQPRQVRHVIVMPGLLILVPAIAITGGSGMYLSKSRRGRLVESKKKRMPFIAANGLLIMIPCAIFLNRWAAAGTFDTAFYVVQALELLVGAVNLSLMGMNVRDGFTMSGRVRASKEIAP